MTSLRIPLYCAEVVIGQDDWIISHLHLTLKYSSKAPPLDGVDDNNKIYCLENGYSTVYSFGIYCFYMQVI